MKYDFVTLNGFIYHIEAPNKEIAIAYVQKQAGAKIATTKEERDIARKVNSETPYLGEWEYTFRKHVPAGWTENGVAGEKKIWKLVTNVGNAYPTTVRYGWTAGEEHEKIAIEQGWTQVTEDKAIAGVEVAREDRRNVTNEMYIFPVGEGIECDDLWYHEYYADYEKGDSQLPKYYGDPFAHF